MINVHIEPGHISITGHSCYARPGYDIICASVSVLAQNLIFSIEALTEDRIDFRICEGDIQIEYKEPTERTRLLIDSFFIGICRVIDSYPDYVRLE